jgi:hypothetical protein
MCMAAGCGLLPPPPQFEIVISSSRRRRGGVNTQTTALEEEIPIEIFIYNAQNWLFVAMQKHYS